MHVLNAAAGRNHHNVLLSELGSIARGEIGPGAQPLLKLNGCLGLDGRRSLTWP
ncbi:MAG TPA: hypothetical protein VGZ29_08715 [Terriglobia bacterium]|nr:hypothetical protein [Terriglobia bacterium]